MKKVEDLHILYLAKYAPTNVINVLPESTPDKAYGVYHYDIYNFLSSVFHKVTPINDHNIVFDRAFMKNVDYVFSLYNRLPFKNSEIFISAVLESQGIPYLGATPNIRALAEDKSLAKALAVSLGIKTPKWVTYDAGYKLQPPEFEGPYFVKPRFGATSTFISKDSICNNWNNAKIQIEYLHRNNVAVLLEQYIAGQQVTSPILNNFNQYYCLPCVCEESNLYGNIITYEQKRKILGGLTRSIVEDTMLSKEIKRCTDMIFKFAQPLDYARCDYIVEHNSGDIMFLEFNVCCNLGTHAAITMAANHISMNFESLLKNITFSSLLRQGLIEFDLIEDFKRINIPIS